MLSGTSGHAQSPIPINFQGWYGYTGNQAFKAGKPWGIMSEFDWKRNQIILKQCALLGRVGISYELKSGDRINAGIAFIYNYPYDAASKPYEWPDYRIFQQYVMRIKRPKGAWQFHIRIDERWLGRKNTPEEKGFAYYQYETSIIIGAKKTFTLSPRFYASLSNEIWLVLSTSADRILDQNRAYGAVGMSLDKLKEWHVELGYMNQLCFNGSPDTDDKSRINNNFRISIISNAPFKR